MGAILSKPVGDFSLGEALAVGVSKSVTEAVLTPLVGNGNLLSGVVKLGGAWALPKAPGMDGKLGKTMATGLAVDGAEDIINAAINWIFGATIDESAPALI